MSEVTTDTPETSTPAPADATTQPAPPAASATPPSAPKSEPAKVEPKRAPAAPAADDRPDPVAVALRSLQADNAKLDLDHKAALKRAESAERERDKLAAQVTLLGQRAAEGANVGRLRDLLPPGKSEIDIRGAVAALHETGKVDRFSADPEAFAKAALDALKASGSALIVPTAPLGGPAGAPSQTPAPPRHRSPFG